MAMLISEKQAQPQLAANLPAPQARANRKIASAVPIPTTQNKIRTNFR